jgi:hypothetical protein
MELGLELYLPLKLDLQLEQVLQLELGQLQ